MFGDHGLADRAVLLHDAHLENVHQADVLAVVAIDVNLFRAPRLIRRGRFFQRLERHDFEEVERHAIRAGHGENRRDGLALASDKPSARKSFHAFDGSRSSVTGAPLVVPPRGAGAPASNGHENV